MDEKAVGLALLTAEVRDALLHLAEVIQSSTPQERWVAHQVLERLGKQSPDVDRIFDAMVGIELAIDASVMGQLDPEASDARLYVSPDAEVTPLERFARLPRPMQKAVDSLLASLSDLTGVQKRAVAVFQAMTADDRELPDVHRRVAVHVHGIYSAAADATTRIGSEIEHG